LSKKNIVKIPTKYDLRKLILSGEFDDPIQVKNTEHICNNGIVYDYSHISDLSFLFDECHSLSFIPPFDTSNVSDMSFMFSECASLSSIPFFDTSNVSDMSHMFEFCYSLTSIPFFDTSNVSNMSFMFYKCKLLISIPFFDISNVSDFSNIFFYCLSLSKLNQVEFLFYNDKFLLTNLKQNPDLFSDKKLTDLLSIYRSY
jgi:surface protein